MLNSFDFESVAREAPAADQCLTVLSPRETSRDSRWTLGAGMYAY